MVGWEDRGALGISDKATLESFPQGPVGAGTRACSRCGLMRTECRGIRRCNLGMLHIAAATVKSLLFVADIGDPAMSERTGVRLLDRGGLWRLYE
jgi:hypothetical protein